MFLIGVIITIVIVIFLYIMHIKNHKKQLFFEFYEKRELEDKKVEGAYFQIDKNEKIDEQVLIDLQVEEIFKEINHTYTTIGIEYLYSMLRHYQNDFDEQEALIKAFSSKEKILNIIVYLEKLEKENTAILNTVKELATTTIWMRLAPYLRIVPIISIVLFFVNLYIGLGMLVMGIIINIIVSTPIQKHIYEADQNIYFFACMLRTLSKIQTQISLPKALHTNIEYLVHTYYKDMKMYQLRSNLPALLILFIYHWFNEIFFLNLYQYNKIAKRLLQDPQALLLAYQSIGKIDVALSIVSFRARVEKYCLPVFVDTPSISINEGYHLLIKNPVTNSCVINRDCIITGSNASGKSTFMKMVGLQIYLGRTIHTCLAIECQMYPFVLKSAMRLHDNLLEGESYYIREIKILKDMLVSGKEGNCFILIDEILRGTNEIERVAIGKSIIKELLRNASLFMLSTHDVKMAVSFQAECDMYCLHYNVEEELEKVTYKLEKGICHIGNAISLLKMYDYDAHIIEEAIMNMQS